MTNDLKVETLASAVRRHNLLAFLKSDEPAWLDGNHPDLVAMGTAEWVRAQRFEPSARLAGRDENLDPE